MNPYTTDLLKQTMKFSDDDLAANRQGRVSNGQRGKVSADVRFRLFALGIFSVIAGIVVFGIAVMSHLAVIVQVAFLVLTALIVVLVVVGWFVYARSVSNQPVSFSEGPAKVLNYSTIGVGVGYRRVKELTVGKKTFSLKSKDTIEAFENNGPYRVYYLHYLLGELLLSAERVNEPEK